MECACSVEFEPDGGDYPSESKCFNKVARMTQRCGECGGIVSTGESYEYYEAKHDDGFFTHKTCNDCLSIRNVFFANGYYFGAILEYFYEFINENDGQISEKCLSSLTPRARELACEHIQEMWIERWIDYPTQPAFRLEKMAKMPIGKMTSSQSWIIERKDEMYQMDKAVYNSWLMQKKMAGPQKPNEPV